MSGSQPFSADFQLPLEVPLNIFCHTVHESYSNYWINCKKKKRKKNVSQYFLIPASLM